MSELSKVLFPNKATGDTFTATEVNEIKSKLNAAIDFINTLSTTVTPPVSSKLTGNTQLFFLGDSITFGVATTYGFSYPQQVMTRLNDNIKFAKVQRGFSGQSAAWFNSNELQNTINMFNFTQYNNVVCVVYFGTNDLPTTDLDAFKTTILATYTALKNAGAKVIIVPVLNRTDKFSSASYDGRRLAFNEYAYANYKTLADGIADMKRQYVYLSEASSNSAFIAASDPDGLTGVHPTNRGAACIAEEVAQAIATLHGISLPAVAPITATVPTQYGTQPPNIGISSSGVGNGAGLPLDVTPEPGTPTQLVGNINWTSLVNVTNTNNRITKTSGVNNAWDASAISSQKIGASATSGEIGRATFHNVRISGSKIFGLSHDNPDSGYSSIDYAFYVDNTDWTIFENGVNLNNGALFGSGTAVFEIVVTSNTVKYLLNGDEVYQSSVAPTFPLFVDTSLFSTSADSAGASTLDGVTITAVNLL